MIHGDPTCWNEKMKKVEKKETKGKLFIKILKTLNNSTKNNIEYQV